MNSKKENKAICIMNMDGLGGAEHRYINLFNHIMAQRSDYFLIVNNQLYDFLNSTKMLRVKKNIKVIHLGGDSLEETQRFVSNNGFLNKRSKIGVAAFILDFFKWLWFAVHFIHFCRKHKIKKVYGIGMGGIWSWSLCRLMKIPLIYSVNSNRNWAIKKSWFSFFHSQYWVLKKADKLDFLTNGLVKDLQKRLPNALNRDYAVSPCSFTNYASYYPLYPKAERAIFAARLVESKNPMLFVEAVKWYNEHDDTALEKEFLLMGEGVLHDEIEQYIVQNNLSNVRMLGFDPYPWRYLRESKIFISILEKENYPSQALMEAMACENVIIASDVGDTRLLVSEEDGVLVPLESQAIGRAIQALFSDKEHRRKKGVYARQKVMQEHSVERFCTHFYSLFEIN